MLLWVDLDTREVIPLAGGQAELYGVSWFPGAQALVLSHSALVNQSLVDLTTYANSEVGYLSCGALKTQPFLSQPHQILCASDGRVVCTNTGRNAITVVDLKRPGHFQEARMSPVRWDRLSLEESPGEHPNSVFEKNGLLFVIAHGHRHGAKLVTFTYPDLELVDVQRVKHRTGLHNIWVTDSGEQISCDSEAGSIIELRSGDVLWESGSVIYTRGLAASSDFVVVGESQRGERALRRNSTCGLWVLDRKTWSTLDYVPLGPYGAIHEVRLLEVPDEAHHGHAFAGAAGLLEFDARARRREQRIEASRGASIRSRVWSGFKPICGAPMIGENGELTADPEDLCLIAENSVPGSDARMSFGYRIVPGAGSSHVSLVVYRGSGSDTDMHALLVSATSETRAAMQLWIHDGQRWQAKQVVAEDLPIEGRMVVRSLAVGIECSVDGVSVAMVSADQFPAETGPLGIRWLGATVFPAA